MKNKSFLSILFVIVALLLVGCSKTTTELLTTDSITTTSTQQTTNVPTTENPTTLYTTTITTAPVTEAPTTQVLYFTVTFMIDDIVLKQETVAQGSDATPPTNTEKASNLEFSYNFNGWDKDYTNVQSDLIIYAIYLETPILYDVTFYDYDGLTVISTVQVTYNSSATPPEDIETRNDEIYTYTFNSWVGDYTNITENTEIYSSYTRTYTTSGDYLHSDFYDLVASTFDIENETNIENNITYLTQVFEADSEEEAYRIFNILVFNYDQLTEFNNFEEFKDIFSNLESGFLTDEKLVDIIFNYLKSADSYFIGLSDLEFTWYNEVVLNYNNFQDQYMVIRDVQNQIEYDLNLAVELLEETLRSDAFNYFYAKVALYSTEKDKFNYFDYLKTYIGNDVYDLNTAIWNILDQANIDPALYDFYVWQYNSICNSHPLYLDKIETFRDKMTSYYNANQAYVPLEAAITSNSLYDDFITSANSLYSTYIQSVNNYFLIKDDLEYWQLQMNGINASMEYLDLAREILTSTENEELYKEALLIIIDDIQSMILNADNVDFTELSDLVTYIVNNQDMYGYLDTTTLFEVITKEGLFNTIQSISKVLDLRYQTITPEDWTILDDAIYNLSVDYANTLESYEFDLQQEINTTYSKATNYFIYFDLLVNELHTFINSITMDEIEKFETLVVNQNLYTQNEYTTELAKLIHDIYSDSNLDLNNFVDSYVYINFFQVDVHIEFSSLGTIENNMLFRMQEFLVIAQYIADTDPSLITEATLLEFYNDFWDWYHDFLFSYNFYLNQD